MSQQRNVTLAKGGGDVSVEIAVEFAEPGAIDVALYGPDRKKAVDIGSALSGGGPDPKTFPVARSGPDIAALDQKIIGVFVSGSSSAAVVIISSQLRQDGAAVSNSHVLIAGTAKDGGARFPIAYNVSVV